MKPTRKVGKLGLALGVTPRVAQAQARGQTGHAAAGHDRPVGPAGAGRDNPKAGPAGAGRGHVDLSK